MSRTPILSGLAVLAVAVVAWRVEAGDGKPTAEDRLAALEARMANVEARLAAIAAAAGPVAPKGLAVLPATTPESSRKALDALRAVRLSVDIQQRPLLEVLRTVAEMTMTNLIVSPSVTKRSGDLQVSLKVENSDMVEVLTLLGSDGRFAWTALDYGVVRITDPDAK